MLNYTLTLCRLLNQALTDRQDTIDQWQYTYDKNSKATAPAIAPYLLPVGKATAPALAPYLLPVGKATAPALAPYLHPVGKATAPALAPYLHPVGNMTQMIYPSGRVITYTRDGVKRIQIITETDLQRNLIKDYVWSNQMMPVAQIDAVIPAKPVPEKAGTGIQSIETITYLYTDHLMTNRLATGQSKAIVWRWEGEAFGNTPAQELGTVSINLRFPGQYYDSETNLHYNMMRYYDPALGRYITSDPVGVNGGLNTYSYANQNPINKFDLLGLQPFDPGPFHPDPYPEGRDPRTPWEPPSYMPGEYCAPYFLIGGGLIPLVIEVVEPISKCKVEVECFYAGIVATKYNWSEGTFISTYFEKEYLFITTKKECCK